METEGSLQHTQEPATRPYAEPDRSIQCPSSHYLKIYLNVIFPTTPRSYKSTYYLMFSQQTILFSTPLPKPCHLLPTWLLNKTIVHHFKQWMNVHRAIRYGIETNKHTYVYEGILHTPYITCFGHLYGHLQGNVLQSTDTSKYYKHFGTIIKNKY